MPLHFEIVFFTVGDRSYRLHFPYMLEGFKSSMLAEDEEGRFTSDTREYFIKGFKYGKEIYDIRVREYGVDIFPAVIDAWFYQNGVVTPIDFGLLASIKMRREEGTQNRISVNINGKPE